MSYAQTLKALEELLESFLERALTAKENRLHVLDGINRLDDITRTLENGEDVPDRIGQWFAEHNRWLADSNLGPKEISRIDGILGELGQRLDGLPESSPTRVKVRREIDRWRRQKPAEPKYRVVLKRGSEGPPPPEPVPSIERLAEKLNRLARVYADLSGGKKHVLSVLDDALKGAYQQKNKEALLLSAFIIYSLKQDGYLVDPYVKRLKEAERLLNEEPRRAVTG